MIYLQAVLNVSKIGVRNFSFVRNGFLICGLDMLSHLGSRKFSPLLNPKRKFCSVRNDDDIPKILSKTVNDDISGSVTKSGKYEVFKDENAPLILDVYEERQRVHDLEEVDEEIDEFSGLNLKREFKCFSYFSL